MNLLTEAFEEFLVYSAGLRPGYPRSLGISSRHRLDRAIRFLPSDPPHLVQAIYSQVEGTRRSVKDQTLMDFLPGFRLIHIDELAREYESLKCRDADIELLPLLGNYSSDYYCLSGNSVVNVSHDSNDFVLMHSSFEDFLVTICEFYNQRVYFLDEDGYLDYDMAKEGLVGAQLNPDCEYWLS